MGKHKEKRKPKAERFVNLFGGFRFKGRIKECPSGLEPTKFEPKIHPLHECDHVRSPEWWEDDDDGHPTDERTET
jgi:hypothetical protein